MFRPVATVTNFSEIEERLISYWKENKTFEKSISTRSSSKKWTFLDGPPFVTGLPHYGSLLSSIPKDLFPRYWTMKGYQVRRVWGWDCHGLPAENKVEAKLGLKSKRDIEEKVGVKKFIDECKLYVNEVSDEWQWYVEHIARWVDFDHAYRTMDTPYMETVMWVFKQLYDKNLVYKGLRVSLYCPHDGTPISNFEVAMDADNYQDFTEDATTYKYQLVDEPETFILAWSTTPWNKIATPVLAVNPDLDYVKVRQGGQNYILAQTTLKMLTNEPYEVLGEMKGKDLVGKKFVPHYDYYKENVAKGQKVFEIIPGDFVTADEGTGVVTIGAYGEEDLKVMKAQNVYIELHLDEEGHVKKHVPLFGGMYYLKANKAVNEDLGQRGLIYKNESITHRLPTCWRCHTRLYYAPQDAWYVNVQTLKPAMKKTNEAVNWFPKHFKYGRFLKSMEHAPDWNISRSRYWGSPVPVWECECGERFVPGSIAELEKAAGKKITDLHKPEIDEITVTCVSCGKKVHRVPEVLDSWIEAGSASFAERHFPFDSSQKLEEFFPPDFIVEYTGQIRAWFYVLHVIGAALYDSPAYKNVVTTGVILGTDGRKMSKNYGNYPDPKEMLAKYGGDALRLYLMGTPVMHGEDIIISEESYRNQVRGFLLILWNTYNYFVTYANENQWEVSSTKSQIPSSKSQVPNHKSQAPASENILDRWIISRLNSLNKEVAAAVEGYDTVAAIDSAKKFVDELSTWYIRRSRDRAGMLAEDTKDKDAFFATTYHVLTTLCQILAPLTPFITEEMYRNLTNEESVHLTYWPDIQEDLIDKKLEEEMTLARKIAEMTHSQRKEAGIKLRQPLGSITVTVPTGLSKEIAQVIADEVNVKTVTVDPGEELTVSLNTDITPDLKEEGEARDIARQIQEERKKLGTSLHEKVLVTLPHWPKAYEQYIMKKALVAKLLPGDAFSVTKA
ncbi:MAG TPA: isoleucine--tRNA ligase [Patescibacteria group bacterium]|nr:isoleucine--tRNA ligase [Patescibacteria group bacterium]